MHFVIEAKNEDFGPFDPFNFRFGLLKVLDIGQRYDVFQFVFGSHFLLGLGCYWTCY